VFLAITALLLLSAARAAADAVRIGGFWINDVSVEKVEGGEVVYYSSGGSLVTKPLAELSGVRLKAYPGLGEAEKAIENENWGRAREKLQGELEGDRPAWLKRWLRARLTRVALAQGRFTDAAERLAALVKAGAHPDLFAHVPLERFAKASEAEQENVAETLRGVEAQGKAEALLKKAEEAIGGVSGEGGRSEGAGGGRSGPALAMHSGIADERIAKLLEKGQFQKALKQVNHRLSGQTAGETARFLYMRGLAQLGLLQSKENPRAHRELALDVGLSFMRIPAHFPESSYAGHAWMEVGYVQALLGNRKKAQKFYDRAANELRGLDEKALEKRLETLRARLAQQQGG
jgi:predicted negative regulator of RcsB-dependent stress response